MKLTEKELKKKFKVWYVLPGETITLKNNSEKHIKAFWIETRYSNLFAKAYNKIFININRNYHHYCDDELSKGKCGNPNCQKPE